MSDIFISYARQSEAQARQIGASLSALGYGVWRDDALPAHRAYSDVIAERLRAAKAVVVIWSAEATQSHWVRAEADAAREAGTLVQLVLDGAPLPLPFNQIQCADMKGWNGEAGAAGWRKVLASVAELTGGPSGEAGGEARDAPAVRKRSICVLPFVNMSGDAEQEYFSDGVSEDIITDLSKVSALFVVSRNSAFQFKGRNVDLRKVARELEVGHVLEGSVRKAGNRVRITAQLVDGATGGHLWAERYDRDLEDIFTLQDEISQAIVTALKLKLLPEERKAIGRRGTDSAEAYDLYLMARQYLLGASILDTRAIEAMIRLCRAAIAADPNYAHPWALIARAQNSLRFSLGRSDVDGLAAAERALSLDQDLAEAHAVKAGHLDMSGRSDEALVEIDIALRLDPESFEVNSTAAMLNFRRRRLKDAVRYYEKAATLMETQFSVTGMLITCYTALGDAPAAQRAARMTLERAEGALAQDPSNGGILGMGASALAVLGEVDRARDWSRRALVIDPDNVNMRYNIACSLSNYLKDLDTALEVLGPFFAGATASFIDHARVDPDLDPVRGDPRFATMLVAAEARLAASG